MYITQTQLENKLGRTLTTTEAAYFSSVLSPGVDAYINSVTGTQFGSTTPTNVYVDGNGTGSLVIPTMHTITAVNKVANDGTLTLIPSAEYYTYPRGEENVYAIKGLSGTYEEGVTYRISGVLGYKIMPADVLQVAVEMSAGSLTSNDFSLKSEKVGDWSATYAEQSDFPTHAPILARYNRLSRSV